MVCSGRDTVVAAAELKRRAGAAVFVVQIQHPRCDLRRFDVVAAPKHDWHVSAAASAALPGNLVLTAGALHDISPAALLEAKREWAALFSGGAARWPRPRVAVAVGGPSARCTY
eukprot:CAMPEP_0118955468 /NCGR_PEP_ID=MMETSP1169-20130426/60026_1 /TAXON_ID=36882 /ORGANISM="Pyramimonas obovata, Strain CCMP722" /LENGTH=113 /DNA_ID=CAMNT_0006903329 /DNA_START=530 /DNA_END=868 /DNA_ORIENTATION=+